MINLLEITGDDIASLGDAELRTLVGLLCEADYRQAGLPTKGITWGGHQDAKDGGLDVVVRDEVNPPDISFVPRCITGFQVKKPDMPRGKILKEMCPDGVLREEIKALLQECGAYIVVSSNSSTTDTAFRNRIEAMQEAVASEKNHQNFQLDFFDKGRVATWVRSHPSLILWVRNKVGRPLMGWHPYENWANPPGGTEEEYILDDGLRLHDGATSVDNRLSVEDGLGHLRTSLSVVGASVRLTGLSGVGKTRLVQALFDERIGEKSLNPSYAIYTDISYGPVPEPNTLATQLIAAKARAILIVDNCPPGLHHQLTQKCSQRESTISLLTVEYDIRDEPLEETSVFRLEPASEEIIEKLIRKRFKHISQVDARTLANFSGGNGRVAIALAGTVQQGESPADLGYGDLFKRLFWQRHNHSESLLVSAEVCSLVYSFEGTDISSEDSEIQFLASFVGKTSGELYRDIAELQRRALVQSRGVWRAVLPHAIANRLAKRALEALPKEALVKEFINKGSKRLIRSFSRRLGYLHDCEPAVEIVNSWLDKKGWIGKSIGDFDKFDYFGIDILSNISPVSPEKALSAIEETANGPNGASFTSRENHHCHLFVRLVRKIAYDPALFNRSVELLCRYALSESKEENLNSTRDVLKSLFSLYLSGTHAPVEARSRIIENLVDSGDLGRQDLGLLLLDAALETWHFSSTYGFSFGARSRDYGFQPKTRDDVKGWYSTFISICKRLALSGRPIAEDARSLLANNLRGLWTKGGMFDSLEESVKQIHEQKAWNEGWISVRGIIRHDAKSFDEDIRARLYKLVKLLRPFNLLEQARTFALSGQHMLFDLDDCLDEDEDVASGWQRVMEKTRQIGVEVAQCSDSLNALLPDLVSTEGQGLNVFGAGLADGCPDKAELFQKLIENLKKTPSQQRNLGVVLGFLSSCADSDPRFYNSALDNLLTDQEVGEYFPLFQVTSTLDRQGIDRLHKALDLEKAAIHTFQHLAFGRTNESVSDDELAGLLEKIITREGGVEVALDILHMRYFGREKDSPPCSVSLMTTARRTLSLYSFEKGRRRRPNQDYRLAEIADWCLAGKGGVQASRGFLRQFAEATKDCRIYAFDYPRLLNSLASIQHKAFLDELLGDTDADDFFNRRIFSDDFERKNNPMNQISDDELLAWCDVEPVARFPLVVSVIDAWQESLVTERLEWKPIVYTIIERAPELESVLKSLMDGIKPMGWTGSLADILQKRIVLFEELKKHDNEEISAWAEKKYSDMRENILRNREDEERRSRRKNERFE